MRDYDNEDTQQFARPEFAEELQLDNHEDWFWSEAEQESFANGDLITPEAYEA